MSTYTATAHREGDWWVVDVAGIGATQAKRLDQVEDMARDMIAIMEDVDLDDVHVDVVPQVGPELDGLILNTRSATDAAKRAQAEATEASRTTAQRLRAAGYSLRDIGILTGVSYQRIHQLLGSRSATKRYVQTKTKTKTKTKAKVAVAQGRKPRRPAPGQSRVGA